MPGKFIWHLKNARKHVVAGVPHPPRMPTRELQHSTLPDPILGEEKASWLPLPKNPNLAIGFTCPHPPQF